MNLVDWIKTNMPAASMDQILGEHSIVPVSGTVRNTSLSYHEHRNNNAVMVRMDGGGTLFTQLPDDTYLPPLHRTIATISK